ncbi:helix-turn-helix domain-containing protein [Klugiella xanthotipulae]|uniref:AraC family transcriptional regulator n=1 Tax=Klugiella xanthotipulae TaxID=244735 RepID=A0A543HXR3_9MICO|nr:helix-turn-helix domain-containing protein [Klugiella xanthotipulae]TQM63111.1 AraC family transcriptional regulator [Klugiella xanthotipulae]
MRLPLRVHGLSRWRQTVNSLILPLAIESEHGDTFEAELTTRTVGDVRFFTVWAMPHTLTRGRPAYEMPPDPVYTITLQIEGSGTLEQQDTISTLRPGDFAIYDSTIPFRRVFTDESRTLIILFPQQFVSLPPRELAQIAGARISRDNGLGRIVSPFLLGIAANMDALTGTFGSTLTQSVIDMVSAAVLEARGQTTPTTTEVRHTLLVSVREYIMTRLRDPDLSPTTIARANFISTRRLHSLFQETGTTVSTWVRQRRLDMARRELADPSRQHSIHEIAAGWGFADPSHFSKLFRATYGKSPREFRKQLEHPRQRRSMLE